VPNAELAYIGEDSSLDLFFDEFLSVTDPIKIKILNQSVKNFTRGHNNPQIKDKLRIAPLAASSSSEDPCLSPTSINRPSSISLYNNSADSLVAAEPNIDALSRYSRFTGLYWRRQFA
jgi:hypothetical protein